MANALNCCVAPTSMEGLADTTLIVVTAGGGGGGGGAVTVSETAAFTPLALAVICAEPAAMPEAIPSVSPSELIAVTDATFRLELDQAKVTPDIALPYWSYPAALNSCVLPA